MQTPIFFVLNRKEFQFPCSIKLLKQVPPQYEELLDLLISHHRYEVQSPVRDEIFQQFLDFWENQKIPEISKNNIWEFYLLSNEFGLMTDFILSPQFEKIFDISYLLQPDPCSNSNIRLTRTFDKSFIERRVATHLNDYLVDSPDDLFSLPITSLYNIFAHRERNLQDYDSAYRLILNAAENKNQHFYILLNLLDGSQMNSIEIKSESLFQRNDHCGFFPEKILPENELRLQNEQIKKLEEINENLFNDNDQILIENEKWQNENQKLAGDILNLTEENKSLKTEKEKHINIIQSNYFTFDPQIQIIGILGNGSFGQVFLVKNTSTNMKFATKISAKTFSDENELNYIDSLSKIENPSILKINDIQFKNILNENHLILTTRYFSEGSINNLNISNDNTTIFIILLGIALGMQYLHLNKIVHGNLKLSNIFLYNDSFPLISDFGLSKFVIKKNINLDSIIYLAPEIIKEEINEFNFKTDVYSYSIIFYFLVVGQKFEFKRPSYVFIQKVIDGIRPNLSKIKNDKINNLIQKCWSSNPMDRPSFYEIIEMLCDESLISSFSVDVEKVLNYLQLFKSSQTIASKVYDKLVQKFHPEKQARLNQKNELKIDFSQILSFNVVLTGTSYSGKTTMLNVYKKRNENLAQSPLNEIFKFQINENDTVHLSVFETSGSETFRNILYLQMRKADAIIYLINVNLLTEIEDLQKIIDDAKNLWNDSLCNNLYLATTHSDLGWSILKGEVQAFAEKNHLKLFFTSKDDYDSIDNMFKEIVDDLVKRSIADTLLIVKGDEKKQNDKCLIY